MSVLIHHVLMSALILLGASTAGATEAIISVMTAEPVKVCIS